MEQGTTKEAPDTLLLFKVKAGLQDLKTLKKFPAHYFCFQTL